MPIYVYGCGNDHQIQRAHSIHENPVVVCSECGKLMHRIPQPFMFYMNPAETFLKIADEGFEASQKRRAHRKKVQKGIIRNAY